jgi:hypothetical protein
MRYLRSRHDFVIPCASRLGRVSLLKWPEYFPREPPTPPETSAVLRNAEIGTAAGY